MGRISLAAVFIALILFAGCAQPAEQQVPTPTIGNATAVMGDFALIDYILQVNITDLSTNVSKETLYDTSLPELANSSHSYNSKRSYGPMLVKMSPDNGLLAGFTRGIVGLSAGQKTTVILGPSEGYGEYNPAKVFSINKTYSMSRYEKVPMYYFQVMNLSHQIGDNLSSQYLKSQVVNYTNQSVTIKYLVEENQSLVMNGLPQTIILVNEESMTLRVDAQLGKFYVVQSNAGTNSSAKAISIGNEMITFDGNHPLAGKDLKFTIILRELRKI